MPDAAIPKEQLRQKLFSFDTEFHYYYTERDEEYRSQQGFVANFGD